jgi:hypothetical protein
MCLLKIVNERFKSFRKPKRSRMCLLIAVNERFKSFRMPERLEIALHIFNNVIYDLFVLLLCIYMHIYFIRCK